VRGVIKFSTQLDEALKPLESDDVFESDIEQALEADDRTPWLEPYIVKDLRLAYPYARNVIKGRWPELESYIMKNPKRAKRAYQYALDIIKGRWPEAEPYIMERPKLACAYAHFIIKGRWFEAEPYIMKDPQAAHWYTTYLT